MCGRYNLTDSPQTQTLLKDLGVKPAQMPIRFNIAPTEYIPVVFQQEGKNQLIEMRWWLVPSWSDGPSTQYAMFNARCESLATSRAFKGPYRHKRAIIPASAFIEWRIEAGGKQPYLIEPVNTAFAFAGLWDHWSDGELEVFSCAIITTEATPSFQHIHNRMPLILHKSEYEPWLSCDEVDMSPRLPNPVQVSPIDKAANNARNKDPFRIIGNTEEIS